MFHSPHFNLDALQLISSILHQLNFFRPFNFTILGFHPRDYMKQRCHWSSALSFRLAVSVKLIKQPRREMPKTVGVLVNYT